MQARVLHRVRIDFKSNAVSGFNKANHSAVLDEIVGLPHRQYRVVRGTADDLRRTFGFRRSDVKRMTTRHRFARSYSPNRERPAVQRFPLYRFLEFTAKGISGETKGEGLCR